MEDLKQVLISGRVDHFRNILGFHCEKFRHVILTVRYELVSIIQPFIATKARSYQDFIEHATMVTEENDRRKEEEHTAGEQCSYPAWSICRIKKDMQLGHQDNNEKERRKLAIKKRN